MDNIDFILLCLFFAVLFLWIASVFRERSLKKVLSFFEKRLRFIENFLNGVSDDEV